MIRTLIGLTTLLAFSTPLYAATITFNNKQAFLAAAGDVQLESFENGHPTAWSASGTIRTGNNGGHHPTHGDSYKVWGSPTTVLPAGLVVMDFGEFQDTPVSALGFYVTDFGDTTQPPGVLGELTVTDDLGRTFVMAVSPPTRPNAEELFFGIISDEPMRRFTVEASTINDGLGYDEVYFRYAIPEPSTYYLILLGSTALFARRRFS